MNLREGIEPLAEICFYGSQVVNYFLSRFGMTF